MDSNQDPLQQLLEKLEALKKQQDAFSREIISLRMAIYRMQDQQAEEKTGEQQVRENSPEPDAVKEAQAIETVVSPPVEQQPAPEPVQPTAPKIPVVEKEAGDLERFIGENLISKVGIIITVLGVAIGAKYAIDHDLISPLTRIILGYLVGAGLFGVALRLKKRYHNFSAVLLSGAVSIAYFITFAAFSFYSLVPQVMAFGLMVLFTVLAVGAAIWYDREVIAHLGLVGAYAVPYLLGDESGQVSTLLTYTAIINVGILFIAFRRYWKSVYYSAFGITWLIFLSWYLLDYGNAQFGLGMSFLSIYFVLFYSIFLGYKILKLEAFKADDVVLLLLNSFLFYAIGYDMLDHPDTGQGLLGAFTLGNALLHFFVAITIYRVQGADRNLFFLVSGLALLFITLSFPVQLDGNWVTLLWIGEAALVYWIGRTRQAPFYERLAYPLFYLAFFSLLHDWGMVYNEYRPHGAETWITPVFNIHFLSSLLFIAATGFIFRLQQNKLYPTACDPEKELYRILRYSVPAILLYVLYFTFRLEIASYWDQHIANAGVVILNAAETTSSRIWRSDLLGFKTIWLVNYSLLFTSLLVYFNNKRWKDRTLGYVNLGLTLLNLVIFLSMGLYMLSELRENYLSPHQAPYYQPGMMNIAVRYISFGFLALLLGTTSTYTRQEFIRTNFRPSFDILLHLTLLWVASSELLHWMDIGGANQSYKLGLSILWGVYALLLIVLGIWKGRKYLRISAMVLFGGTLLKLFFYDIAHLDTIDKTIVFLSLGILLLIISFLYNKYKDIIAGNETRQEV
ncbi:MAG: DUF2339 domain-containing protein [Bacteroidetes bacterium]|nr:MAG: DUF2339 domain-containing protein [Bacteroidota bacterium]